MLYIANVKINVCLIRFSMNTDGCSAQPCPPEEELNKLRITVMVLVGLVILVAYLGLVARPVTPELDWLLARALQGAVGLMSGFMCLSNTGGDMTEGGMEVVGLLSGVAGSVSWLISKATALNDAWKRNQGGQFLKIILTYVQVLGSFTVFTIEWPPAVVDMFSSLKVVAKIDLIQVNGLSCLFMGVDMERQLYTYTIGPICFLSLLALPIPVALIRGYAKGNGHHAILGKMTDSESTFRWRQVVPY